MKLERTISYNFGWLVLVALVNVAFLLVFFLLLSSNFILQAGCGACGIGCTGNFRFGAVLSFYAWPAN